MGNNLSTQSCICGSGKQYEKCYGVIGKNNECLSHLQNKQRENMKIIQEFIDQLANEVSETSKVLQKTNNCNRSWLIIIFSFQDALARIWSIYAGEDESKKTESFRRWYITFCATSSNEYRNQSSGFPPEEIIYKIRSSLTHSFSIGNYGIHQIGIINGAGFNPETEEIRLKAKKSKELEDMIIICPSELYLLGLKGAMLMIEKMSENLSNKKNLLSINRLALELQKEGCAFVPLN